MCLDSVLLLKQLMCQSQVSSAALWGEINSLYNQHIYPNVERAPDSEVPKDDVFSSDKWDLIYSPDAKRSA